MRHRLLGLLSTAVIIVSACGTGTPSESPSASATVPSTPTPTATPFTGFTEDLILKPAAYAPDAGKDGGNVVVADWQAYTKLNPYYTSSFKNFQVMATTMPGNWIVSPDGKWIPYLVTQVPRLSDGTIKLDDEAKPDGGFTITLQYKPGLVWSDGKPLTMNDMKWTAAYMMDPTQVGLVAGTTGWELIDKFDVSSDGLTGTVHFKKGFGGVYGLLSTGPLPQHYMEKFTPATASDASYPIGTTDLASAPVYGPFKYGASSADQLELVRNENFKVNHLAHLDKIVFKFYTNAKDAMIAAFLNKEVDLATDMLNGDYASIAGVDATYGKANIHPAWEYEHLDLNQLTPALKDLKVRQAIFKAIDQKKLWETVFPGVPRDAATVCAPVPPGLYWRNENLVCPTFDVEAAKKDLADAGWKDTNGDGFVDKDGKNLTLEHCSTPAPFRQAGGDAIAAMLKTVGIQMNTTYDAILFEDWAATDANTKCNIYRGTYDTAEFAYVLSLDIFGDYYYSYHSSQVPTDANGGSGGNTMRINNPEMDKLLDGLATATVPATAYDLAQKIQEIYVSDTFEVPLYYRAKVTGQSNRLGNYFTNPSTTSDMWNTEDWYVKE